MIRRHVITLTALLVALVALPAAASARGGDRNRDRIPDRWERANRLSLRVTQARRDPDRDGLSNLREYRAHTNPRRADTDARRPQGRRRAADRQRPARPRHRRRRHPRRRRERRHGPLLRRHDADDRPGRRRRLTGHVTATPTSSATPPPPTPGRDLHRRRQRRPRRRRPGERLRGRPRGRLERRRSRRRLDPATPATAELHGRTAPRRRGPRGVDLRSPRTAPTSTPSS